MIWREIPSLHALRAFEAVARCDSLTAAADELNVTHAAVSQHLRTLEADLDVALTRRAGRSIALTDDGRRLAAALGDGFGRIEEGIRDLRQQRVDRPLAVSLTPSFAENWLMPRLGGFWAEHPEIEVSLRPSTAVTDLRRDGIDLAIRYGRGDWPGLDVDLLVPAVFSVVASPAFVADRGISPESDLAKESWFLEKLGGEDRRWAASQGLTNADTKVSELETMALCLAAARAGLGLSVGPRATILRDIESGTLVELAERETEFAYFLVRQRMPPSPPTRAFIDWLKRTA